MFKKGEKLVATKVHRCEHSSDFKGYAVAMNPTFEMSSEHGTSIRQLTGSLQSSFSRQRASRGQVNTFF